MFRADVAEMFLAHVTQMFYADFTQMFSVKILCNICEKHLCNICEKSARSLLEQTLIPNFQASRPQQLHVFQALFLSKSDVSFRDSFRVYVVFQGF